MLVQTSVHITAGAPFVLLAVEFQRTPLKKKSVPQLGFWKSQDFWKKHIFHSTNQTISWCISWSILSWSISSGVLWQQHFRVNHGDGIQWWLQWFTIWYTFTRFYGLNHHFGWKNSRQKMAMFNSYTTNYQRVYLKWMDPNGRYRYS